MIDTAHDRRIDVNEFVRGISQLGLQMSQSEAMAEFKQIDVNRGGQVLFVEFCAYIRKRVNPDTNPNFDADIQSGEKGVTAVRRSIGHSATHANYISRKSLRDFNEAEAQMKK